MRTSTWPIGELDGFGCCRQIMAHLGGMTRAWLRGRPIHFAFHWSGICRAIVAVVLPTRNQGTAFRNALQLEP